MSCPYPSTDRPPAWSRAHRTDGAGQRAPFFTSRKNTVKNHRDLVSTDTTLERRLKHSTLSGPGGDWGSSSKPLPSLQPHTPLGPLRAPLSPGRSRHEASRGPRWMWRLPAGRTTRPRGGGVPLPALSLPLSHGFGSARALRPAFGRAHGGEL